VKSTLTLVTFGFISYFERALLSVLDAFCRITGPMSERGICVFLLGFPDHMLLFRLVFKALRRSRHV
jgi:hypothetical protein